VPPARHRRDSDLDRILRILHGPFTGEDNTPPHPTAHLPTPGPGLAPASAQGHAHELAPLVPLAPLGLSTDNKSPGVGAVPPPATPPPVTATVTSTVTSTMTSTVTTSVTSTVTSTGANIPVVSNTTSAVPWFRWGWWGGEGGERRPGGREGAREQWQGQAALEAQLVSGPTHPCRCRKSYFFSSIESCNNSDSCWERKKEAQKSVLSSWIYLHVCN